MTAASCRLTAATDKQAIMAAYVGCGAVAGYGALKVSWALGSTLGVRESAVFDAFADDLGRPLVAHWSTVLLALLAMAILLSLVYSWGERVPRRVRASLAWLGAIMAPLGLIRLAQTIAETIADEPVSMLTPTARLRRRAETDRRRASTTPGPAGHRSSTTPNEKGEQPMNAATKAQGVMNMKQFLPGLTTAIAAIMLMMAVPAAASPQASVTAGGAVILPAGFEEFAGDHVQLHVTAQQRADGTAEGRFSFVHQRPPGIWARASGIVTCLDIDGPQAVVTGLITHGTLREGGDDRGELATFTLLDDPAGDAVGLAFSFWGIPIAACEPLPTFLTWSQGNITVHPSRP